MNKLTIPALLLGVVMIAGAFAFMPVQEASTVHLSGTVTLAASQGTIVAIDVVDLVFDDGTQNAITIDLVDATNFPAGQHYTASFIISLNDDVDTVGNTDVVTVVVQVWDGDQWVDTQVVEPAPADSAEASTIVNVAGEVTAGNATIRFIVDEAGTTETEASLDVQGTIEIR